jgi:hypothetical protein
MSQQFVFIYIFFCLFKTYLFRIISCAICGITLELSNLSLATHMKQCHPSTQNTTSHPISSFPSLLKQQSSLSHNNSFRHHPYKILPNHSHPSNSSKSPPHHSTSTTSTISTSSSLSSQTTNSISYLKSSPLFEQIGFRFHDLYKVMICITCKSAWLPSAIPGHLKNQHKIYLTSSERHQLLTTLQDWDALQSAKVTTINKIPVELLRIHPNAYCCNKCTYCALSSDTLHGHWNKEHKHPFTPVSDRFHIGHVQTFFNPVPKVFFQVNPPPPSSKSIFDIFLAKELPTYPLPSVSIPTQAREIPPLLTSTLWHIHLSDYLPTKSLRQQLRSLIAPSHLSKSTLWILTWKYMLLTREFAQKSSMRAVILLNECPQYVSLYLSNNSFLSHNI